MPIAGRKYVHGLMHLCVPPSMLRACVLDYKLMYVHARIASYVRLGSSLCRAMDRALPWDVVRTHFFMSSTNNHHSLACLCRCTSVPYEVLYDMWSRQATHTQHGESRDCELTDVRAFA